MSHFRKCFLCENVQGACDCSCHDSDRSISYFNAALRQKELTDIAHIKAGVSDGCVCGLCEAVREEFCKIVDDLAKKWEPHPTYAFREYEGDNHGDYETAAQNRQVDTCVADLRRAAQPGDVK